MQIVRKGNTVTLTFDVKDKPYVSKTEEATAAKAGRPAVAKSLFSSGGFVPSGDGLKISVNVITAG